MDVRYCFDKNGRGTREVLMSRGDRCVGSARARFDSSGKLRFNADGASCQRNPRFSPEQVDCTQGAGNKADCYGVALEGERTRWKNPFRRE